MTLRPFLTGIDPGSVGAQMSVLLRLLGLTLAIPMAVAAACGEPLYVAIFAGLAAGTYATGRLTRRKLGSLELRDALVATALAYVLFALVGGCAYLPVAAYEDCVFEAMSGFTTTGLSVLDVESLPASLLFFRAYSQWIGGVGIIVLSLAVLLPPGRAASRFRASRLGDQTLVGSALAAGRVVLSVLLVLTAASFVVIWVAGTPAFQALLLALATVSTGGFSPHAAGLGPEASAGTELALVGLMSMASISLPLLWRSRREGARPLLGDPQVRLLALLAATGTALMWLGRPGNGDPIRSLFHAVSSLTTSGFALDPPRHWSEPERVTSLGLMLLGGATGSTAGGLKLLRILLLVKLGHWLVVRVLLPEEAHVALRLGDRPIADAEVKQVAGFLAAYLGLLAVSVLALVLAGHGALDALYECTSALSTVGLSVGITSSELPIWTKLVLAVDMWAGRLEVLPVLVLLYPYTWRRRRPQSA